MVQPKVTVFIVYKYKDQSLNRKIELNLQTRQNHGRFCSANVMRNPPEFTRYACFMYTQSAVLFLFHSSGIDHFCRSESDLNFFVWFSSTVIRNLEGRKIFTV